MPEKPTLNDHSRNVFSQFGEDGIIEKIFETIGTRSKTCVEFGAWDGFYHANTAKLWSQDGWKGVLIEPDDERFTGLEQRTKPYGCVCIHSMVENDGAKSLESLLATRGITEADLVSIDIDGDDYHVFNGLNRLHPRIVVCEFNPTIPKHLDIVSQPGTHFGCSSRALVRLGEAKGYRLVAMTDTNCIFVTADEYEKIGDFDTTYDRLATEPHVTYLLSDYSGNYALSRPPPFGLKQPLDAQKVSAQLTPFRTDRVSTMLLRKVKKVYRLAKKVEARAKWHLKLTDKVPPAIKISTIRRAAKGLNAGTFVETGTYLGDTLYALKDDFTRLYSIEIDNTLYRKALKRFAPYANVQVVLGDSATRLPEILRDITGPAVFWLDGHYSGGITGRGALQTPVMQELAAILEHPVRSHLILIDDAKDFNGTNDYPTVEDVRAFIHSKNPQLSLHIANGMMIIRPTSNV